MALATTVPTTGAMTAATTPMASAAARRSTARPNDGKHEHQRGKDRDGSSAHGMATASERPPARTSRLAFNLDTRSG